VQTTYLFLWLSAKTLKRVQNKVECSTFLGPDRHQGKPRVAKASMGLIPPPFLITISMYIWTHYKETAQ